MPNLTVCLKKVGDKLDPADKAAVLNRSRELRSGGMGATEAAKEAVKDVISGIRAELKAAEPKPASQQNPQKKHPKTVMGSELLAIISDRLGGLDPSLISEYSVYVPTGKLDKKTKAPLMAWRNPMIPGIGLLFRRGGRQDRQEIAQVLEDADYLEPGAVAADYKEAGERAKDLIKAALDRNIPKTLAEQQAEMEADQEAERQAYYDALDEESAREADAERAAIMAEAELSRVEVQAADDDLLLDVAGTSDTATQMRALGFSEQEIADELARESQAQAPVRGEDAQATPGAAPEAGPAGVDAAQRGPEQAAEGLTLEAPTPDSLKARAARTKAAADADAKEQKRLADKAKADAEAPEFTLTGSDRPADVAAAAGQGDIFDTSPKPVEKQGGNEPDMLAEPDAPAYSDAYATDLFGNPVPAPAGNARRARSAGAAVRGDAQSEPAVPGDTAAPAGDYNVRTTVGVTAQRQLGAKVIKTAADAAAATQYLYKSAVERLDGIVVDKDGKPLAVVGGFKGALAQASVYPATLVGEAVRVPGAAAIWFSHNHPSGSAELSSADVRLAASLADVFKGSGIEPKGLLAVGGGKFSHTEGSVLDYSAIKDIPAGQGALTVPVIEREQQMPAAQRQSITSPAAAKVAAASHYAAAGKKPGLLLLDNQNAVSAWVPLPSNTLGLLRGTGGLNAIYRAVSEANAGAAILVHGGELDAKVAPGTGVSVTLGQNIGAALAKIDVRPLDIVNGKTLESVAEQGLNASSGPVLSQRPTLKQSTTRGTPLPTLKPHIDAIVAKMTGLRNKVEVVATVTDLPKGIVDSLRSMNALGTVRGLRMPDGRVFLIADQLDSRLEAEFVLLHEIYGHEGLRAILSGEEYAQAMTRVRLSNPKVAAEADAWMSAYGAGQISARVQAGMTPEAARREVRLLAVEEALADRAGKNEAPSAWKNVMAVIQKALRRLGMDRLADWMEGKTEAETYALLMQARKAITEGKPHALKEVPEGMAASGVEPTFYSALLREMGKAPMKSGTAQAWGQYIDAMVKRGAIKADEVEWTGLREWLALQSGKITQAQIGEYLSENGVQVTETVLGEPENSRDLKVIEDAGYSVEADDMDGPALMRDGEFVDADDDTVPQRVRDAMDRLADGADGTPTKYGQYTLPGGTNYREVLLTLPVKTPKVYRVSSAGGPVVDLRDVMDFATREKAQAELASRERDLPRQRHSMIEFDRLTRDGGPYRSNHWDQPNILAHIRLNDRTSEGTGYRVENKRSLNAGQVFDTRAEAEADMARYPESIRPNLRVIETSVPKRTLFVEEIQSDWAQEGKKKGFRRGYAKSELAPYSKAEAQAEFGLDNADLFWHIKAPDNSFQIPKSRFATMAEAIDYVAREKARNSSGPPSAPFVVKTDAWVALAIKRVISIAAREGYDRVAFVTGDQSAERYDLSKQVDQITYEDGTLRAFQKRTNVITRKAAPEELPDIIGKEVAQRLLDAPVEDGRRVLMGESLKVGGEGMRAFYDKIVPAVAKDVLRKVGGGQMGAVQIGAQREISTNVDDGAGGVIKRRESTGATLQQPGFDIAPAMREKAAAGLPLFSRRDATSATAPAVTVQPDPNGNPEFAGDGVVLAYPQPAERFEFIPGPGQRLLNYAIMPAEGFDSLGFVELVVENGRVISLMDIEINSAGRRAGVGRKVIETLLAANPEADLNISNIVHQARGFWAKMGVPEQNLEDGAAYDGTLNWQAYAQAANDGRAAQVGQGLRGQARQDNGRGQGADRRAAGGTQAPVLSQRDPNNPSILLSQRPAATPAPAPTPSRQPLAGWRDPTNRLQFAPGQWLYDVLGRLAAPLLIKLQFKAATPELRRQLRQMKLDVQKAQDVAAAVAKQSMRLSESEREMVSDIIEREMQAGTVPPTHAVQLAAMMTQAMGAQSQELVRLGMLSPEAAARWDGAYLPRFYESKLRKQASDAWADAVKRLFGRTSTMKGIKGKHLKGRGLYERVAAQEAEQWEQLGWELRDPDFPAGTTAADLQARIGAGTLAADEPVMVWRDFTRDERDNMGEIRDAGFRFVMGYMQTQRDIALGRMFEKMATDPASSSRTPVDGWVQVPNTTVEGTGAKRYGKLSGRYVPKETLSHLTQIEESQSAAWQFYRKGMAIWKAGKTAMNPVSHMNNILSNLTMAHFAGVSYHRADKYVSAIKDFATASPAIKEARDAGLFLGSMTDAELVQTLPKELQELVGKTESKTEKGAKLVFDLMTFFVRKPMGAAYQAEDTFFRYLIYKDARDRGASPDDAVDYAQKYIFAYDDLPKGARMVRDFGIPFFAYTYKAVPALLHTALTHPVRFAAPASVLWAANALGYAIAAGDDDDTWDEILKKYLTDEDFRKKAREMEQLEREHLPPWMKGTTALLTPKAIRLGMDEVTKLPLFIDVARIIPGGDIFDVSPNAGGVPMPQPLTLSHPLFNIATGMIANKDLWTGKDLVDKNDTTGEAAAKRSEWLWKQISPAMAIGNGHWERGMNALAQASGGEITWLPEFIAEDYTGLGRDKLPVQPKFAAMQTFGIKVRPIDLEAGAQIEESQKQKMIRDIDAEMRTLRRLRADGVIKDRAYDKAKELAELKKDRLREGLTVDGKPKP